MLGIYCVSSNRTFLRTGEIARTGTVPRRDFIRPIDLMEQAKGLDLPTNIGCCGGRRLAPPAD
jgi:hypothetical protein